MTLQTQWTCPVIRPCEWQLTFCASFCSHDLNIKILVYHFNEVFASLYKNYIYYNTAYKNKLCWLTSHKCLILSRVKRLLVQVNMCELCMHTQSSNFRRPYLRNLDREQLPICCDASPTYILPISASASSNYCQKKYPRKFSGCGRFCPALRKRYQNTLQGHQT